MIKFHHTDTHATTCGGSLISSNTILSAAHCFRRSWEGDVLLKPVLVEVTLGEHNIRSISPTNTEQKYTISNANIEVHPQYNHATEDNDIAKLRLDQPIDFARHPKIHPICLPASTNEDFTEREAKATGWGRWMPRDLKPAEVLQEINTTVISLGDCNQRLTNFHGNQASLHVATEKEICAIGDVPLTGNAPRVCRGGYCLIMKIKTVLQLNFLPFQISK